MKAWTVKGRDDYECVVFAETRGKAISVAMGTDCCEDMQFTEIRPMRFKEADKMYKGLPEMDWDNDDDRFFLCENGWTCPQDEYDPCECEECCTKIVCTLYCEKNGVEQEDDR